MSLNNVLNSPIGIDHSIQRLQTSLFNFLSTRWSGELDAFGRAYRNIDKENDFILEWYSGLKKDYEDVYFNDSSSDAVFFFIDSKSDDTEDRVSYEANLKLVIMCDLSRIYPNETERMDEAAKRDVVEAIRNSGSVTITGIEKDMDLIFSGVKTEKIKFNNIHPKLCFAVLLDLNYYLTDKCN